MKTRSSDAQRRDGLPPPPAPTARDANPWPMSQGAVGQQREPRHPRAPWIPLLYLFVIAGLAMQFAIRALWRDDVEAAVGAVVMLLLLAFAAQRWIRKRKH